MNKFVLKSSIIGLPQTSDDEYSNPNNSHLHPNQVLRHMNRNHSLMKVVYSKHFARYIFVTFFAQQLPKTTKT